MIETRRLTKGDLEVLRTLRLEALTLHPEAYSAEPDMVAAWTDAQWRESIATAVWLGGLVDSAVVATAVLTRPQSKKVDHIAELSAVYVRAGHRGSGIADALIRAVIAHAAEAVEQVMLRVNADNARAIRLYERHGFRQIGRIPRYIRVGDRFHDELIMIREVSPSD